MLLSIMVVYEKIKEDIRVYKDLKRIKIGVKRLILNVLLEIKIW